MPLSMTELMLVNSLHEIERLEDQIGLMKSIIERQNYVLDILKANADFRASSDIARYVSIGFESVYRMDTGFRELMDALDLEDPRTEEKEEENE